MSAQPATFDRRKLYGILHDPTGAAVVKTVKVLKVGIGIPSGPDIHVWIAGDGKWHVATGVYQGKSRKESKVQKFDDATAAERYYLTARASAPERLYPARLSHFTFLRMGPTGYVHDFAAIGEHGVMPTEIDIVFLSNDPFDYRYALYTKTEMKCEGNGHDARRRVNFAQTPAQRELADAAEAGGERFFALEGACSEMGCPFAGVDCKPHSTLYFQLQGDLRFGGDCTFSTTGFRSTGDLFSSLEAIKKATGRGRAEDGRVAGIPLKLVLRPYRTKYKDSQQVERTSIQYAASVEYRAGSADALSLVGSMLTHADDFEALQQGTPLQLGAASESVEAGEPIIGEVIVDENEPIPDELLEDAALAVEAAEAAHAAAVASEYYPEGERASDDDLDQFSQTEPTAPPAMPQRKSAAAGASPTQVAFDAQAPLGWMPNQPTVEGVTFPRVILAAAGDKRLGTDDMTLLSDEAQRIGKGVTSFCQEILGLKPNQITRETGMCLLKLMKKTPSKT